MQVEDFFVDDTDDVFGPSYWYGNGSVPKRKLDLELLASLRRGNSAIDDIEAAVPLARLIHDELLAYGTGGGERTTDEEMRAALLAMTALAKRLEIDDYKPEYSGLKSFKTYWVRNGAHGSWQGRRDLLETEYEPVHRRLIELEDQSIVSTLARAVSPRGNTGWSRVDEELTELRRHFERARTRQDYSSVGNICVRITEALSAEVYNPAINLRPGEEEPPVDKTKARLGRYVEDALQGAGNAELRKLVRSAIELAQAVKHGETPTRLQAGIAADSVILVANLLRRLQEQSSVLTEQPPGGG